MSSCEIGIKIFFVVQDFLQCGFLYSASTLRSVQTPAPPPSTLRSSTPSARPTLPPPLGNLRWPDVSTHHHVTMSPEAPRRQIRDNMFVRILTLLEEMKETQKIQGRMLQTLLQQRGNISTTVSSTPEGFPLKTVRDVELMEEKLANPNFMAELVCMLSLKIYKAFFFFLRVSGFTTKVK